MTDTDMETAILMARFKIQARKHLDLPVDLDKLEHDETYAQALLQAAEQESEDEGLLVLVMRLRACLKARSLEAPSAVVRLSRSIPAPSHVLRDHRFGARG